MKYQKWPKERQGAQTDIEESFSALYPLKRKHRKRRVPKYKKQLKRLKLMANYIKIMRFRAEKLRKTLRVYVYDQNSLGWPYRFTKKINKMTSDNDRDSDQELIEDDKNKCLQSLFQAIQQRKQIKNKNH